MKQGKSIITLVMVILALTLCVYFGFYVFDTFNEPYSTTHTYQYTHYESAQANGVLIRTEQVLEGPEGIVELQCGEGERLGVNQTAAYVYRDAQAQRDSATLEALSEEIAVLAGRNDLKVDYALAAVRAGCHVLADKPLVIDDAGYGKLVAAVSR